MIRVLLADDHHLFREGIKSILHYVNQIKIVAEASDGVKMHKLYFEFLPDVVLTDISMPGISGLEAAAKILRQDKNAKFLFLTMHDSEEYIGQVLKIGGLGLITKNSMRDELVNAIRTIGDGKRYFPNKTEYDLDILEQQSKPVKFDDLDISFYYLTDKEMEILKLVGEGLTSDEIAEQLEISRRTIDKHRSNIMKKFNITSLPEFLRLAIQYSQQQNH